MKNYINKAVLIISLSSLLLLMGCTNQSTDGNNDGNDMQETYEWVAQSPWPKGGALHEMAQTIADDINEASGGRLVVEMHAADEIVAPSELLDAVDNGTIDVVHNWDGYWTGQIPELGLFASDPMGMDEQEYLGWMQTGGGLELLQEAYDKKNYKVKVLTAGAGTPSIFLHSNKPIRTIDDLKGTKIRTASEWAKIMERLGASVVNLSGGEVYQALERGVVDAAEFSSPAANYPAGLHEVTKYISKPAIHQPTTTVDLLINEDRWNELPDDLKHLVKVVAENAWGTGWAELLEKDLDAMAEYQKLEEAGAIEFVEFEEQEELKKIVDEFNLEREEEYPEFKTIRDSQRKYLEKYEFWNDFMELDEFD